VLHGHFGLVGGFVAAGVIAPGSTTGTLSATSALSSTSAACAPGTASTSTACAGSTFSATVSGDYATQSFTSASCVGAGCAGMPRPTIWMR
jgi:hypothetical protein